MTKVSDQVLNSIYSEYERFFKNWNDKLPQILSDPSQAGLTGITKNDVTNTIKAINAFLKSKEANLTLNPISANVYVRNSSWRSTIDNCINFTNNIVSNPGHWVNLIDHFNSLISYMNLMFAFGPNLSTDKQMDQKIRQKIESLEYVFSESEEFAAKIKSDSETAEKFKAQIELQLQSVGDLAKRLDEDLIKLKNLERGINQQGLASSFKMKSKNLEVPLRWWLGGFVVCLVLISFTTFIPVVWGLWHGQDLDVSNPSQALLKMVLRVLTCSPIIWLAWFTANQYSKLKRVKEEYEYKVAVSEAFYGYNQQASFDEDLRKELLSGAIKIFVDNPAKLLDGEPHKVSPFDSFTRDITKNKISGIETIEDIAKSALSKSTIQKP